MTWAIEDHDGEVVDIAIQRLRDDLQVLSDRAVEVDLPGRRLSDDQLLHIGIGRVQETTFF